ncbi:putative transcription factor pcc1 protein [Neofusicoccum parvum UCRNP2]|uniref:Putative transcription factor pcc1 protein n=1 Tax=Botryosphaeria parva (strain UCR-NP2) TaxID=1287680 RepID=R1GIL0_BOTPV|nr:putative transcription factor pcc1 protein [Neofusicoccum parvum UCRNP2]
MAAPTAFPCALYVRPTLNVPFPTPAHADTALRALRVDEELSALVKRTLAVSSADARVLDVHYAATTNRMLRVAVNGFFDSLGVVLGVMEELDEDTVMREGKESVEGAQGLMPVKGSVG